MGEEVVKFAVVSDSHLWPLLKLRYPNMVGDSFLAMEEVFRYCLSNELPLIMAGDIFDVGERGGVSTCLKFLSEHLSKREDANLETMYIVGNHDEASFTGHVKNEPWLSVFDKVIHLEGAAHTINGFTFTGLDYRRTAADFETALDVLPCNDDGSYCYDVLVLHQGLLELLSFEGAFETSVDQLDGMSWLTICGHTHIRRDWATAQTTFLSPGGTVRCNASEDDKYFQVVEMTRTAPDKVSTSITHVPIHSARHFLQYTALNDAAYKEVLGELEAYTPDDTLPPELRQPFVSIKFRPNEEFYRQLTELAVDRFFLNLTPVSAAGGAVNLAKFRTEEPDDDVIERVTKKHIDPATSPELFSLALEIQQSAEKPEDIIDRKVTTILENDDD